MRRVRLLLGGWTLLVLAFLYLPILIVAAYSLNKSRLSIAWEGFTLDWYVRVFSDQALMRSIYNSLIIAAVSTGLSVILGAAGAWALYRYRFPMARTIDLLIHVPIIVPEVIMGVSFLVLFAMINRWTGSLPLGFTTVILAHVTFCFPFALVLIRARLAGLDPSLEEAALDLGATPLRAFVHVILPWLLPSIVAAGLLCFVLSLDEFIVTWFTAGAGSRTLPLEIYGRVKKGLDPSLNAVSTLLTLATVALVPIAELFQNRRRSTP
jgi:spermidine/putrescine transport system permease protein